ncbi:MAG: ATP phosphoribosyltransferase [Pseudomonadota bacterium]
MLTIALNKGSRILGKCLPLLAAAGLEPEEDLAATRRLVVPTRCGTARLIIMRGDDVPTYVEHGAADMGVVGKDTLLETTATDYYERLDLGVARCQLMTAGIPGHEPSGRLRVATKFAKTAVAHFAARQQQVSIIKLSGALELAPQLGLADQIVDLVETGNTLKANGLVALDRITDISTRVIVNRAAMKTRYSEIEPLIDALRAAVERSEAA